MINKYKNLNYPEENGRKEKESGYILKWWIIQNNMIVLFVSPNYGEKGEMPKGGVGMYLRRVSGALKELGHTPIILSLGTRDRHYVENGIEIFFVHCDYQQYNIKAIELVRNTLCKGSAISKKIKELSQERKIDIIQFSSISGLAMCYFGKIPAVMRLSSYAKLYYRDYRNKAEANFHALCERLAAQRCNAVFAPSNVHANSFAADIHRKVSVIETPFWNDCETTDDSIYREKLNGKKYFLFYGRLTATKGILVISEILQQFLQLNPEYYFVCCGIDQGNGYKRILQKSVGKYQDRLIQMKPLPHKLLYPLIQHADFVILPSLSENFSNACMEAMYFERVVIGTDGASYEQLIDDGKSGLLCIPGDANSLLKKMNEAAAMNEFQKVQMGKNAKKRIERLTPEITVNKLLRYYRYVIDNINK